MIRRAAGDDWLLISQVDHARLATDIAAVWGNRAVPFPFPTELQIALVRAVRLHDDGWYDWEAAPTINPATGTPREFTEMPMAEATRIWTRSIEVAARGTFSRAAALRKLESPTSGEPLPLSPSRSAMLDGLLATPWRFTTDEFRGRCASDFEMALPAGDALEDFERAGLVRRCGDGFEITLPTLGENPLGGLWVSRHFANLCEQARENRDDPDDLAACDSFLAEQTQQQTAWRTAALEAYAGEHVDRLVDAGFRLVKFFDWVSLWICCAERTTGTDMHLPGGPVIRFEPVAPDRFELDPWPLSGTHDLRLTVPAQRLPRTRFTTNDEYRSALAGTPTETLTWTLTPKSSNPE